MSGNENYTINDLMKKITLIGKNKTLNDMIKSIDEKLKPVEREQQRKRLRTYLKAVAWVVRRAVMKQNRRNTVKC